MRSSFIIGGKAGDCVQMTGAFHAISERTGHKVNVVCSTAFAPVFDGCSFVNLVPVEAHWSEGMETMKQIAKERFGGGVVLQFWNDASSPELKNTRGVIELQMHGKHFKVDPVKEPHYSASMFRRVGFTWDEAMQLRPVFDVRDSDRESALMDRCWPKEKRTKPMLLVTFDAQSSPWGYLPEVHPVISPLYRHFHVVDLGRLQANRVYDMLILFENAVGLITVDTLALHLVAATDLPYIAFTQNGWLGSVPKGNCVLNMPYGETLGRLSAIKDVLERWTCERNISSSSLLVPQR